MGDNGLSHEDFFKVFHTGGGFTSGCGSMLSSIYDVAEGTELTSM